MKYTREQMQKRIMNYLMKTSKHLFVDGTGRFNKIMLTKVDSDEWVYITVRFNGDTSEVIVKPIVVRESPHHCDNLAMIQDRIFPKWETRKSVPYFKDARVKMFEILKLVRREYDGTKESLDKINEESREILNGMQFNAAA